MSKREAIPVRLEHVATQLVERGQNDLASEITSVVADLRQSEMTELPPMLTTGEAARALGIRSVFTIRRWVGEGILDGQRRGGRVLVTRESVERLLRTPLIAEQYSRERALADALDPFDVGDENVPPLRWSGKKP